MTAPRQRLLAAIILPPGRKKPPTGRHPWLRLLGRFIFGLFVTVLIVIGAAWSFGAVWFDAPFGAGNKIAAAILGLLFAGAFFLLRSFPKRLGAASLLFAAVLAWWLTLKATGEGDWQKDVAQLGSAEIDGDEVTLHNVRNCDYRTELDYTPRWETRSVKLSQITGIDIAIDNWGSPWIAHPIISFQFVDAPPVCFSIETRKKAGQTYSAIEGLYRQFELIYIVADESDVIRVRTNYRKDENIYLYHTTISPERARERFLEYTASLNALRAKPRWYNAITTNCTTAIRSQHPPGERMPWDWRILLNGKGDEMLYERHMIVTDGLPFAELKAESLINPRAQAAGASPDFSKLIRVGLPAPNPIVVSH